MADRSLKEKKTPKKTQRWHKKSVNVRKGKEKCIETNKKQERGGGQSGKGGEQKF